MTDTNNTTVQERDLLHFAMQAFDTYVQHVNETDPSEMERAYSMTFSILRDQIEAALASPPPPPVVSGERRTENLEEFLNLADELDFSDHYVGGIVRHNRQHFFNNVRSTPSPGNELAEQLAALVRVSNSKATDDSTVAAMLDVARFVDDHEEPILAALRSSSVVDIK